MSECAITIDWAVWPMDNGSFAGPISSIYPLTGYRSGRRPSRPRLPRVTQLTLQQYYGYLKRALRFPFRAWTPEIESLHEGERYPCVVTGLIDPASGRGDTVDGIYCHVRVGNQPCELPLIELELPIEDPNCQLVERYWDWFWHCA